MHPVQQLGHRRQEAVERLRLAPVAARGGRAARARLGRHTVRQSVPGGHAAAGAIHHANRLHQVGAVDWTRLAAPLVDPVQRQQLVLPRRPPLLLQSRL